MSDGQDAPADATAIPAPGVGGVGEKYGFPSPYDLDDRLVKLVAYTIVSVQRDRERVMKRGAGTVVVTKAMSPESFAVWRIAEYLASEDYAALEPEERLAPSEERYLRVDYVVSRRWARQPSRYDSREITALQGIRDRLP
jgi:hypothetical protein